MSRFSAGRSSVGNTSGGRGEAPSSGGRATPRRGWGGSVGRQSLIPKQTDPFMGYNIQDMGGGRIQVGQGDSLATIIFGDESSVNYEGTEGLINLIKNSQGSSRILKNMFSKHRTAAISPEESSRREYFKAKRTEQLDETDKGDRFANAVGSSILGKREGRLL